MKKNILYIILCVVAGSLFSGCKKYLDIIPTGVKVPATIADYRAFLENYNMISGVGADKRFICNEFVPESYGLSDPITAINFNWDENGDRIGLSETNSDYSYLYKGVYLNNLVINDVPKIGMNTAGEKKEADELVAQAKIKRALLFFNLVNTFAKVYNPVTSATDPGIPYPKIADDLESQVPQETVAKVYENLLDDLNAAIPDLPEKAIDFLLPNKAAGYALRARIHLFMQNYEAALNDAEEALKRQDFIFDLVDYHRENVDPMGVGRSIQDDQWGIMGLPGYTHSAAIEESYVVMAGLSTFFNNLSLRDSTENQYCTKDSTRFEEGDTRFLCSYYRDEAQQLYINMRADNNNYGGLRTTEAYLIRAECLARKGLLEDAMKDVNAIRSKRILKAKYQPLSAVAKSEAIGYIRHERDVELSGSDMMFYDMRRLNLEPEYQRTMRKKGPDGIIRTLTPRSDLWVLPFPKNVTLYNNSIKQNTGI